MMLSTTPNPNPRPWKSKPQRLNIHTPNMTQVKEYLAALPAETFGVMHSRKQKDFTLSLAEENLITALSVDG